MMLLLMGWDLLNPSDARNCETARFAAEGSWEPRSGPARAMRRGKPDACGLRGEAPETCPSANDGMGPLPTPKAGLAGPRVSGANRGVGTPVGRGGRKLAAPGQRET